MTNLNPNPCVSVIIPTYNRPEYLKAAIDSVLNQSFQDFEIIVADDCSQTDSQSIAASFQDYRICFHRNSTNLGVAQNVTLALQSANGKYITSLNDDDVWEKYFLEKLVTPLEDDQNLVLAFCDYFVMDAEGVINDQWTKQQSHREKRDRLSEGIYQPFYKIGLVDQAVFASSAAVIRKAVLSIDELPGAGVFWDYYLVYLACRRGGGAYYCPERLALYRRHPQSENMLSGNQNVQAKIRKGRAGIYCYERFAADAPEVSIERHFEREWSHANTTLAIGLMRDRQNTKARPYLLRSLRYQPFSLRTLVALGLSFIPQSIATPISYLSNPGVLSKAR